uniref:Uncharacterized protein n=1 Tax=Lutzomyia longipalpis TaxID=7200 RepID=A0A1B0CP61_LUTLO
MGEITSAFSRMAKPTPCQKERKITDLIVQNLRTGSKGVNKSFVAKEPNVLHKPDILSQPADTVPADVVAPSLSTMGEITSAFSRMAKPTPCQKERKITDLIVQNLRTGSKGVNKSFVAK